MFKKYMYFMVKHAKIKRAYFFMAFAISLLLTLINIVSPIISRIIIDDVFFYKDYNYLIKIITSVLILYIIAAGLNILNTYVLSKYSSILDYNLKIDFFDNLQKSSYAFNLKNTPGEIYYRMFKDCSFMVEYFIKLCIDLIIKLILSITIIILMVKWSAVLTLFISVMVIVQIFIIVFFQNPIKSIVEKQRNIEQDMVGSINEHFKNIMVVKALGLEKLKYIEMKSKFDNIVEITIKNTFTLSLIQTLGNFANQLWFIGLVLLGSKFVYNGIITLGTFMGFYMLTNSLYSPIMSIVGIILSYQELKVSYNRFLSYYDNIDYREYEGTVDFSFSHSFKIENLYFSYDRNNEI